MRIPIYFSDLAHGQGFKRLTRTIQSDGLGTEPVRFASAQDLLARCLGYENFHDVTTSVPKPSDHPSFSSLEELLAETFCLIGSETSTGRHCGAHHAGELMGLVDSWPFLQLSADRSHYRLADIQPVSKTIVSRPIANDLGTLTPPPTREWPPRPEEFSSKKLQPGN